MKNNPASPLSDFTGRLIKEAPPTWPWGPPDKEKKRMHDILEAIASLRSHGLCGAGVIGAYHVRRVAPLMACALPLFVMMPVVELSGTVLAQGSLCNSKIAQRIKGAMDKSDAVFPIPGHPVTWAEPGFIELLVDLGFWASVTPLSEHAAMRAVNHATDEWQKKDKDDKEKKWWVKERAKL